MLFLGCCGGLDHAGKHWFLGKKESMKAVQFFPQLIKVFFDLTVIFCDESSRGRVQSKDKGF